ncbi:MAG: acetyl/propionyl/methylcrotonyl-CoA carboxylase subunit alpha [Alphaproteobacteria bacterium]|nr:acetyl/propionyl/methylcrotonyl-CoA carboxylase subunit alpha [Alphaproteobacteria bacterium]MBT4083040.1 acetyl/propionyl/methylcrotonyl-CoA carboxylase subunit alpha [Alphaproteobacteria bacterium]MBT4542476.1 acetyl/propionyl/methylcrotonyl-CoA carboxylase subunit alpha [Alphaproteobacteria bacterium]MBT7745842.1 acetyl/propionyl/methylcrotonyl-CoA carboxylase subunit alpha [Alphaproteobacteria bacterium]
MFDTLLIANRGEIACRVMETARKMGIRSVAVFSDADTMSRHVTKADEAHHIGPPPASQSYLDADKVLAAAKASGARAIHPGYGFLSENAAFAEACDAAGIIFVGPPPSAIRAMGEKHAAKALMVESGVPVVPGYHEEDQDDDVLKKAADGIGYPVLIKATSGGGGKGMRRVDSADEFAGALAGARREGKNSFGDDRVLIEKYLEIPRHIEVQVFADNHGNAVYLFERDCSLQRRHQKVIEEAPAPDLSPDIRKAMGEAAVKAALAIGYRGAGTIEFIVDVSNGLADAPFYFMEMNTRLQVEHPVTEMITGVDLVEWQLRVASGEPLPLRQEELSITGHAMEVRIYAENPVKGFLPSTGLLKRLRFPDAGPHVRIDTGVEEGDEVTPYYDPMIAKLIVWDEDRNRALRRLRTALQNTQVVGVKTNTAFLSRIAVNSDFADANLDTGFIERHIAELVPEPGATPVRALAISALAILLERANEAAFSALGNGDPTSPWHQVDGWRMNDDGHDEIKLVDDEEVITIPVRYMPDGYQMTIDDQILKVNGELEAGDHIVANIDGVRIVATVLHDAAGVTVIDAGHVYQIGVYDVLAAAEVDDTSTGGVVAPLPGKVVAVLTEAGISVDKGTPLMIVEAMKMEHTITAPADGLVDEVLFAVGDSVDEGSVLVDFKISEA